jgi:hypothetical protein
MKLRVTYEKMNTKNIWLGWVNSLDEIFNRIDFDNILEVVIL